MSISKILKIVFNPNEELHAIIIYIILSKYQSFWDCCNFELHILHAQFTFSFVSFWYLHFSFIVLFWNKYMLIYSLSSIYNIHFTHVSPLLVNVIGGFPEIAHPAKANVLPLVMIHDWLFPKMYRSATAVYVAIEALSTFMTWVSENRTFSFTKLTFRFFRFSLM